LSLLQTLKSHCKYKKRGCQEQLAVHKELARHEANCPFGDKESNEDSKEGAGSSGGGIPSHQKDHQIAPENTAVQVRMCRMCNRRVPRGHRKTHNCNVIESQWCDNHKNIGYCIYDTRIANLEECKKHLDLFRCLLCRNLTRRPLSCKKCRGNFCKLCLT
jgi:hypothetical protein